MACLDVSPYLGAALVLEFHVVVDLCSPRYTISDQWHHDLERLNQCGSMLYLDCQNILALDLNRFMNRIQSTV